MARVLSPSPVAQKCFNVPGIAFALGTSFPSVNMIRFLPNRTVKLIVTFAVTIEMTVTFAVTVKMTVSILLLLKLPLLLLLVFLLLSN